MGFTKLDEGILKSSIMAESAETFKVWIGLLASCEPDGIARVSSVFLSSACHLSIDVVDKALDILKSPDSRSRTKKEEGRRILEVDGGYFIVNYEKYRGWTYSQKSEAVRKREYRKNRDINVPSVPRAPDPPPYPREVGHIGTSLGHVGTCPGHSASVLSYIDKEFLTFWDAYPRKESKKDAYKAWRSVVKAEDVEKIMKGVTNYASKAKLDRTEKRYLKLPAGFLRDARWEDYQEVPKNEKADDFNQRQLAALRPRG